MDNTKILEAIDKWQKNASIHPLTCGNNSNHEVLKGRVNKEGEVELYCIDCDYVQKHIKAMREV